MKPPADARCAATGTETAFGDPGAGSGSRDFPHYEAPDTEVRGSPFGKLSDGDTLRVAMLLPRSPRTARPMPTSPPNSTRASCSAWTA